MGIFHKDVRSIKTRAGTPIQRLALILLASGMIVASIMAIHKFLGTAQAAAPLSNGDSVNVSAPNGGNKNYIAKKNGTTVPNLKGFCAEPTRWSNSQGEGGVNTTVMTLDNYINRRFSSYTANQKAAVKEKIRILALYGWGGARYSADGKALMDECRLDVMDTGGHVAEADRNYVQTHYWIGALVATNMNSWNPGGDWPEDATPQQHLNSFNTFVTKCKALPTYDTYKDATMYIYFANVGSDGTGNGSQLFFFYSSQIETKGKLKLNKASSVSGLDSSYYSLEDAEYTVKKASGDHAVVGTFVTDANGTGHVGNVSGSTEMELPAGSYTITETRPPKRGFKVNTSWTGDVTITSGDTETVNTTDEPVRGRVRVIKKRTDGTVVPLAGFKFSIRKDGSNTSLATATTGSDGLATFNVDLDLGKYYIKETAVVDPFTIDPDEHEVNLTEANRGTGDGILVNHVQNENNVVPVDDKNKSYAYLRIIKQNKETGQTITKAGFKFELYNGSSATGNVIGKCETDDTGMMVMKNASNANEYLKLQVPGTYTFKEVGVPAPWNITTETITVNLEPTGTNGVKNGNTTGHSLPGVSNAPNVIDCPIKNSPQYGRAVLTKKDALDEQLQDGAQFKVILKDASVTYPGQGGQGRTPSCGYPVAQTTALTKGTSTFDAEHGTVTITNPVVFSTNANGGTTDTFTAANGTVTTGWLPIDQSGTSKYALVECKTSDGHLINGEEIPFTLTYDGTKVNNATVATTVNQIEQPNEIDIYKVAKKDKTPIKGATLGFWTTANNLTVNPTDARHDTYALRVSDTTTVPVLNQQIDGAEIDGSGIMAGYVVHLVMEGHEDIVIDVEHDEIEHAPVGTYRMTLKNSEGRDVTYTGPSTIESKEGSAINVSVTQSTLTGKMLLDTTVGEIANRQATTTYDEASHTYITRDLKPHSKYNVEIDRKTVKVIETSEKGGTSWFGRYSTTDSKWFADHYIDQGALPKKDSDIMTKATLSGKEYVYNLVTDENGLVNVKRIPFGSYVLAEIKPAVDTLAHKSWLVDTSVYKFTVDSTHGYIKRDDIENDTFGKKKTFEFIDDVTKLRISKKEATDGPEIPGAQLTIISKENDVVDEWISTEEPHYIENLQPGTYTLIERLNPKEYEKANSVQFNLLPSGEIQHTVMFDVPISIKARIDKRQEIARPLDERYEANADENNAQQQSNEGGSYSYSLDFRNDSNTWTDEFTVTDPMEPATDGLAYLESVVTPQAFQDYDGKMNVWYRTNKTPEDYVETAGGIMSERKTVPKEDETETTPGETGNTSGETGNTSATTLTLTPVTDSDPVTIGSDDAAVIAACSVKIGDKTVGSLTPALSGYTVAFDKRADMLEADAPNVTGFPTVTAPDPTWSFTAKGETMTDESTSCKNTITIKHGDSTYTYIITYTCSETPVARPKGANATVTDGHVNPWLDDKDAMSADTDGDKRILDFHGWKLWEEGVSATVAKKLNVSDLNLAADEHITGVRFEYGRVEVGFKTRVDDWERELLKSKHDDLDEINGTSPVSFSDASQAADAAASRARIFSEFFTTDASKAQETHVATAMKQAKKDYEDKLISIDEYNSKLETYAKGTLPRFAEALVLPPYSDDDTADDVVKLDTAIQAAKVSVTAAFEVGNPTPVGRTVLLEASTDALEDVRSLISPELAAETADAIASYSTAMDKVPVPAGGEELDAATQRLQDCLNRILDEIRLSGLSGRVMYAPAVMRMRLTDKYVLGTVLRNSADVDAYRNGGNSERSHELEGHDHDEVEQRLRRKDIHIGTRLATRTGEKTVTSDGTKVIVMIDTVDYHGLTPGHEYVISGDLHIRKVDKGTVSDGGAIAGTTGSTRFVPTSPDGTVDVEMTLPAGHQVVPTVAYEELRVVLPETGQVSDYLLAEHKNIEDSAQTVNVTAPAKDLVKMGDNIVLLVAVTMCLTASGLMIARMRSRKNVA